MLKDNAGFLSLAIAALRAQKPQTIKQSLAMNATRSSLICDVTLFSKQSWQRKCAALGHSNKSWRRHDSAQMLHSAVG
jgi:hypothetical protein